MLLEGVNISDMMDHLEDHQRMDAESGAIIVARNHGEQSWILMIEEPIETEHKGTPMQQFFIHAPKFEWFAQIGQGADDIARQAMEHMAREFLSFRSTN